MSFQLNQFRITNQVGEVMNPNVATLEFRLSSTYSVAAKAGDVVKFAPTEVGDLPVVTPILEGDAGIAVVLFNAKKATYAALDVTEFGAAGSIVTMPAAGALNRGQLVSFNQSSKQVQATASTNNYLGYTYYIASNAGDIVRVHITPKLNNQN